MISEMITTAIETVTIAAAAATIRDSESKYFSNVLIGGFPLLDLCLIRSADIEQSPAATVGRRDRENAQLLKFVFVSVDDLSSRPPNGLNCLSQHWCGFFLHIF